MSVELFFQYAMHTKYLLCTQRMYLCAFLKIHISIKIVKVIVMADVFFFLNAFYIYKNAKGCTHICEILKIPTFPEGPHLNVQQ